MSLITGTDNADTLSGTSGDDTVIGNAGSDIIDGGGGFDIVAYWTSPTAVVVRLFANIVDNDGFFAQDTLSNISGVAGSGFDDILYGSDLGNYMQGLTGNDSIFGLGGDDMIRAGEGNDEVDGGAGTDRMFFFGARSEYTISSVAGGFLVVDNVAGRDGTDTVLNVDLFQFNNTQLTAAEILDPNAIGDGLPYPRVTPPAAGFGAPDFAINAFGAGASGGSWSLARNPRELADVNGDGRDDIVGFGEAGVYVSLADGTGRFGPSALAVNGFGAGASGGFWTIDQHPRTLADVNGDGREDIVGFGNAGVWVALADGAGGFEAAALRLNAFGGGAAGGSWSTDRHIRELADVNGDGRDDIVGFGEAGVFVSLADGTGGFGASALAVNGFGAGASGGFWTTDQHPRTLADVNGDGRDDIVGFGNAGVWVALADGSGGFGAAALRLNAFGGGAAGGSWSTARHIRELADVNGDGRADVVGFGEAGVFVSLADGTGGFGASALAVSGFGAGASGGSWTIDQHPRTLADVNGDGREDVVGFGNAGVYVALANGSGGFAAAELVENAFGGGAAGGSWSTARHIRELADVTGDGSAEIVGFGEAGVYTSIWS